MNTKNFIFTVIGTLAFTLNANAHINAPTSSLLLPTKIEFVNLMLDPQPVSNADANLAHQKINDLEMTGAISSSQVKLLETNLNKGSKKSPLQNDPLENLKKADMEMTESPLPRYK